MTKLTLKSAERPSLKRAEQGGASVQASGPARLTLTNRTATGGTTLADLEAGDAANAAGIYQELTTADTEAAVEHNASHAAVNAAREHADRLQMDSSATGFWLALVFQSPQALAEFLIKSGWLTVSAEAMNDQYVCGEDIAKHMGIALEFPIMAMPKHKKNQNLARRVAPELQTQAKQE